MNTMGCRKLQQTYISITGFYNKTQDIYKTLTLSHPPCVCVPAKSVHTWNDLLSGDEDRLDNDGIFNTKSVEESAFNKVSSLCAS